MPVSLRNALLALGITGVLMATIFYAVQYLNSARVNQLNAMQKQLSVDSLSLETQFSLLESAPCNEIASSTTLADKLADLGTRLTYAENQLGTDDPQVIQLKQQYTLLEIRDYIITKRLSAACKAHTVTVLYFYSTGSDCTECERAGYALSYLRDTYPHIRIYSFDTHLDLSALKTLMSLDKVNGKLPVFIINGKASSGFSNLTDLQSRFPKGSLSTTTPSSR